MTAGNRLYRVAGVLQPTGEKEDGMVIADIADVQALAKKPGAVTYFEVAALCKDCPVEDIVAQIGQALPGARVSAIRQVVESRKAAVDQLRRLGFGVSAIVLLIGGLMVLVTVMGGVQERTREIGVLRAVGFRKRSIFSLLFWETGWVSLFSSLLGAGTGIAVAYLASPAFGIEHPAIVLLPGDLRRRRRPLPRVARGHPAGAARRGPVAHGSDPQPLNTTRGETMEPIIHLKDVSMVYGGNGTRATALAGISFDIRRGEYVVITGESGAGKSTLLTILGGLQVPTEGAVRIDGADLSALPADGLADFRRETIGFVFQAYHLLPYLTARENVMVPMSPERVSPREKASLADALLASVGLAGKEDRLPSQLSGGESQRVAIARALVHDPPVLLADEPTGNLDSATGEQILDLFSALHARGKTVLMVTHNPANLARATRSLRLRDGRVEEDRLLRLLPAEPVAV